MSIVSWSSCLGYSLQPPSHPTEKNNIVTIGVWGGGAGGAAAPPPQFGQTVGEIRAKQEEKIGQRKLQINPFGMWMMTSHRQCPRGGGGACECPRVGVFFKFWEGGWRHAGNVQGGCACGYLCKISGKSPPLPPPLTKAFPYAYDYRRQQCRLYSHKNLPPSRGLKHYVEKRLDLRYPR